jgi:hypothetical protein
MVRRPGSTRTYGRVAYAARVPRCRHAGPRSIGSRAVDPDRHVSGLLNQGQLRFAGPDRLRLPGALRRAQWILNRDTAIPPSPDAARWEVVHDGDGLAEWEQAWRGADAPPGVFRAELLDHDSVTVLVARSGDSVVGISNFFTEHPFASASWSDCLALAGTLFPGSTFVGYESGQTLAAARTHGFETVGPYKCGSRKTTGSVRTVRSGACDVAVASAEHPDGSLERTQRTLSPRLPLPGESSAIAKCSHVSMLKSRHGLLTPFRA